MGWCSFCCHQEATYGNRRGIDVFFHYLTGGKWILDVF